MAVFEDREKGEEAKYAHDQETQFRINAHRNKLLALWAADRLALSETDQAAYVKSVLAAALDKPGDEAILQKVYADLLATGLRVTEAEMRREVARLTEKATEDIVGKSKAGEA